MEIMQNGCWRHWALFNLLFCGKIFREGARMATYIITGATGYIGSMLVKYIKEKEADAEVITLVRDKKKATAMLPGDVQIIQVDLALGCWEDFLDAYCIRGDYIIHCASTTKSTDMILHPVEVIESIVNATQHVMRFAMGCQVKSVVYLSSMEVYGDVDCSDGHRVTEDEIGKVDILNTRSCYPMGKRMAENICFSYYKEYGVPVKIARLAQTFGRGVLPTDNRVFAQFANSVRMGTDIVLHTEGKSIGNYCSIDDVLEAIDIILKKGENGEAYNVVNEENTMSIRAMAELVAGKIADNRIGVVFDIPIENRYGYAKDTGLRLSSEKLEKLGWEAKGDLVKMYRDMLIE